MEQNKSEVPDTEQVEHLHGYSIPVRELTPEEANRELTPERFSEFMGEIGEDFLDGRGGGYIPFQVFAGYLIAKEPHLAKEIIEELNNPYGEMLGLQDIINEHYDPEGSDWEKPFNILYTYICDFCNMTVNTKMKINRQLIQILEN